MEECLFGSEQNSQINCSHKQEDQASNQSSNGYLKKQRVLQFRSTNPNDMGSSLETSLSYTNKSLFCNDNNSRNISAINNYSKYRFISKLPERILDAPGINDDYYLNLLDWSDSGITSKSKNGVLAVCLNNEVFLWQEDNISSLMKTSEGDYVSSVSWMPSNRKSCLAIGLNDSSVQLWDAEKALPYRVLRGHQNRVSSMSWNGGILSTGSRDCSILNHDIRIKNSIINRMDGHEQEVCGLKWSPDGTQLASGSNDNTLRIWDLTINNHNQYSSSFIHQNKQESSSHYSSNMLAVFQQHQAAVKALAWCPWQRNLLASGGGTQDKTIKFWNTEKLELTNSVACGSQVCALIWNPHEKELLSSHGFQDNQLTLWNYSDMKKITELTGHTNRVLHMALSPDATTVCSASSDETLRFWKVFGGDPLSGFENDNEDDNYAVPLSKMKKDGPFSTNLFLR